MRSAERVNLAIQGQPTDRAPRGELAIEPAVIPGLLAALGLEATGDFFHDRFLILHRLNMDLVSLTPDVPWHRTGRSDRRGRAVWRDGWGRLVVRNGGCVEILTPAITAVEQIKHWRFPNPDLIDLAEIRNWRQETDFFVMAVVGGGFSPVAGLFDYTEFLRLTVTNPAEVAALVREMGQWQGELARRCLEAGAHGVVVADDLAGRSGTIISPADLNRLVFPTLGCLAGKIKATGAPVFLHSDGCLLDVLDDIVAAGFSGLHSLEPAAGMDLAELKQRYGAKLCLWGNLPAEMLLPGVPLEEVRAAARQVLAAGAPGGGFIFGNCTGVLSGEMSPANILAMYETPNIMVRHKDLDS